MKFSIIIPTYNRSSEVIRAIDSSLDFIRSDDVSYYEIIVIDDFSNDKTFEELNKRYESQIRSDIIKVFRLDENKGVVAARNFGVKNSSGDWMIFLDSDNELLRKHKVEFEIYINKSKNQCELFRCVDENNKLIGPASLPPNIDLDKSLNGKGCELFGVYKKEAYVSEFFNSEVENLRRFESIAFFRLLNRYQTFGVSNLILRKYYFDGVDRLSSKSGLHKDARMMMIGHYTLLKDFWRMMSARRLFRGLLGVIYYFFIDAFNLARAGIFKVRSLFR